MGSAGFLSAFIAICLFSGSSLNLQREKKRVLILFGAPSIVLVAHYNLKPLHKPFFSLTFIRDVG